jgi:signal transduction histidine kinase
MNLRSRILAFVVVVIVVSALVGTGAIKAWRRIGVARSQLAEVQSESLRIAEEFQRSFRQINDTLARYGVSHKTEDWDAYLKASDALNVWIDVQKPRLSTRQEKQALEQIDTAYDDYRSAALSIHAAVLSDPDRITTLADWIQFQSERGRLAGLGRNLADAHRDAMEMLLAEVRQSVGQLGLLLLATLGVVLLLGGGFAWLVYRDTIAPLRVKLVESLALVERQEKLASLGVLAAGVAHEIRNPLTAVKASIYLQLKRADPESRDRAELEMINREILRMERILRDFLHFARPAEPRMADMSVSETLKRVYDLMYPGVTSRGLRLVMEPVSVDGRVRIDPEQIQQVLVNLVQNAADASKEQGVVTLRARTDSRPLGGRVEPVVVLEVIDTGHGIPTDVERRLFDPFFSTKSDGTGLGLSIAARIVQKHGGALQYQTQPGHGTTFGVVLPRLTA